MAKVAAAFRRLMKAGRWAAVAEGTVLTVQRAPVASLHVLAQGQAQFFDQGFSRTPPPDLLLLQRKFIGTFLLCARLRARVDLAAAFGPHL